MGNLIDGGVVERAEGTHECPFTAVHSDPIVRDLESMLKHKHILGQ